jgi:hypothetical protein
MARIWGSLNLLVFIKISSIIKPEKILLLKPVNWWGITVGVAACTAARAT